MFLELLNKHRMTKTSLHPALTPVAPSTAFVLKSLVLMHQDHQAEIITWTVLICNNLETGTHFSRKVEMQCSYFGYYNKDVLDNVVDEIKSNVHMDLNLT